MAKKFGTGQCPAAMVSRLPIEDQKRAERLKTLRRLISGDNQTAFSARVGVELKRWNNFERGLPLSKEVAIQLVRKIPGLTLDWLFLGIDSGIPTRLQRELQDAGKATTSAPAAKGVRSRSSNKNV